MVVRYEVQAEDTGDGGAGGHPGGDIGSRPMAVPLVGEHFAVKLAVQSIGTLSGSIESHRIDNMIGSELREWMFKEYMVEISFQQLLSPTLAIDKVAKTT